MTKIKITILFLLVDCLLISVKGKVARLNGTADDESFLSVESSAEVEVGVWPFLRRSEGSPSHINSSSCNEQTSCSECYNYSRLCHWCDSDETCHPKGSVHGCVWGATCKADDRNATTPTPTTAAPTAEPDSSCYDQSSCTECYQYSKFCHWCEHDQACHPRSSIHGCVWGMTCKSDGNNDDDDHNDNGGGDNDDNDHKSDACSAHTTCNSCADTHLCHWCGHDQACHTIGSIHGCVKGVNCYANDQCKRESAEPLHRFIFSQMTSTQMALTVIFGLAIYCFTSLCFCFCWGVKQSSNDLHDIAEEIIHATASSSSSVHHDLNHNNEQGQQEQGRERSEEREVTEEEPLVMRGGEDQGGDQQHTYEILEEESVASYTLLPDEEESHTSVRHQPTRRCMSSSKHTKCMNHMSKCCLVMYVCATIGILCATLGVVHYFPTVPDYEICNDEIAWKTIFDSLTKMKIDASFELLMSFKNTNDIDIVIDQGNGVIKHSGIQIGTYYVPPPILGDRMSIVDVTVVIDILPPSKSEAFELAHEYYAGNLVVYIDGTFDVRLPQLFNVSTEVNIKDRMINVNDVSPTEYCKCSK